MATIPTPSISLSFGRVRRSADSHVRFTPLGSLYVFLEVCQAPMHRFVSYDRQHVGLLHKLCPHRLALELYA
jgi:hypothetical protein